MDIKFKELKSFFPIWWWFQTEIQHFRRVRFMYCIRVFTILDSPLYWWCASCLLSSNGFLLLDFQFPAKSWLMNQFWMQRFEIEREGVEGNTRPGRETSFSHYPQSVMWPSIFWPPCSKESLEFHELRAVCLFVRRTGLTVPLEQKARVLLLVTMEILFGLEMELVWSSRCRSVTQSVSGGSTEYSTIVPSQKIWLTSEKFIPATTVTKMVIIR